MSGDNDGILGVVVLMVLHIAAGLVSALLSISRLTLTGQLVLINVDPAKTKTRVCSLLVSESATDA